MRSIVLPSWIERLAGLEPRALAPHAFALSRREIVYAAFSPAIAGERRTLLEAQSQTLSESLFGSAALGGPLADGGALGEAIKLLVGRLMKAPKEATLVLPDAWVRGLMIDSSADLPEETTARREVLRFRLKRLVPFRSEELRVEASPLGAADGSETRAFATFANDALLGAIEDAFAAAGVRIGWISGTTAALHAGLVANGDDEDSIVGVSQVDSDGFTLVLSRGGEPVVWRQKTFTEGLSDEDRERLLTAELRLTRTFLEERHPGLGLGALYLSAPRAVEPFWQRVLGEGLGATPLRLRPESVGLAADGGAAAEGAEILALAAAVAREVA